MEEVTYDERPSGLFNSPTEIGLRILFLLEAFYPHKIDLNFLSVLEFLVLHTADVGGPPSLHVPIETRAGEYLVRRKTMQAAVAFLRRTHLIEMINCERGQLYEITQEASALVDITMAPYHLRLKECAKWLSEQAQFDHTSYERKLSAFLNERHLRPRASIWYMEVTS